MEHIYLFNGDGGAKFCGGVFTSKEKAEEWIGKYSLSGVLTKYPVDISVYDWALETKQFLPKREEHVSPSFIGGFTSATQEHFHYEDGRRSGDEI